MNYFAFQLHISSSWLVAFISGSLGAPAHAAPAPFIRSASSFSEMPCTFAPAGPMPIAPASPSAVGCTAFSTRCITELTA